MIPCAGQLQACRGIYDIREIADGTVGILNEPRPYIVRRLGGDLCLDNNGTDLDDVDSFLVVEVVVPSRYLLLPVRSQEDTPITSAIVSHVAIVAAAAAAVSPEPGPVKDVETAVISSASPLYVSVPPEYPQE